MKTITGPDRPKKEKMKKKKARPAPMEPADASLSGPEALASEPERHAIEEAARREAEAIQRKKAEEEIARKAAKKLESRAGGKQKAPFLERLLPGRTPEQRDKIITRAITGIVAAVVIGGVVISALPEKQPNKAGPDAAVQGSGTGQEDGPVDGQPGTAGSVTSNQNAYLEPEDGAEPLEGASDGQKYWVVSPEGRRMYKISTPMGWTAYPISGGVAMADSGMRTDIDGGEPVSFAWRRLDYMDELLEQGGHDYLENGPSGGLLENRLYVLDYWMTDDTSGTEWPVYLLEHAMEYEDSEYSAIGGRQVQWHLLVAKPSEKNMYFIGTTDHEAIEPMLSRRYPDVQSLFRAVFPPSSEPGMPEGFASARDGAGTEAPEGQDAGDAVGPGTESPVPEGATNDDTEDVGGTVENGGTDAG